MRQMPRSADKIGTDSPFAGLLDSAAAPDRTSAPTKPDRPAPAQQSRKGEASDNQQPADTAPADGKTAADAPAQASADAGKPSQTKSEATDTTGTDPKKTDDATTTGTDQTDELLAAVATPDAAQTPVPAQPQAPAVVVIPVAAAPALAPTVPTGDATDSTSPALLAVEATAPSLAPAAPPVAAPSEKTATPLPAPVETGDAEMAKPEIKTDKPVKANATDADVKTGDFGKTDAAETNAPDIQTQPREATPKSEAHHQTKPDADVSPQQNQASKQDKADNDVEPASKPQPGLAMNDAAAQNVSQNLSITPAHAHGNTPLTAAATATAQNATQIANAVPVNGVAVEIAAQMKDGARRFEIRLDPPELGRIDVRLEVDKNGQVTSHLRVDRVETLDMLRRDSANLERALQDAGLKTSDNALNFSLRDQSFRQQTHDQGAQNATQYIASDETMPAIADVQQNSAWASRLGGVDIRV
jgi:flagellar hook-length control protein FliK